MPRRGFVPKRDVLPDPLYNSKLVTKLINNIMLDGKKGTAQKIVYGAFEIVEQKTSKNPAEVFQEAMKTSCLHWKSRPDAWAAQRIRYLWKFAPERRQTLGLRWIASYARNRSEKTMKERLAGEIIDAVNGNRRSGQETRRYTQNGRANKAFAHFRW